jgi:D-alanyl-D-alanine carboxypeptidase
MERIRLSFADAEQVYTFAEGQTGVFVYDPKPAKELPSLALQALPKPDVSALSYVVADADTRDVFLERNAGEPHPISSLAKLMTALVAHETLTLGNMVVVPHDTLPATAGAAQPYDIFALDDLLYALLLDTKHNVASLIANTYGTADFVRWMNTTATALNMQSTHFVDAGGASLHNTASPEDMYRLATYLEDRKSFIWNITRTPETKLVAATGGTYRLTNPLSFSSRSDFIGGQAGTLTEAQGALVSLFSVPVHGVDRKVVIAVLGSSHAEADVTALIDWVTRAARGGANQGATACVACAHPSYRKISE